MNSTIDSFFKNYTKKVSKFFHANFQSKKQIVSNDFSTSQRNADAPLKELVSIAGTNLFLNIPYKWYDRTKPGCYATWFTETYADYWGKHKGVSMVCNRNDQQWYNTSDASWIFERTDGGNSLAEYDGTVRIRNLGTGITLETWKSAGTWWLGLGKYEANPDEDMWMVRTDRSNNNYLQLEIKGWFLAQHPTENHRAYLLLKKGETANFPYSFAPTVQLAAKMYDFEFVSPDSDALARHTSQKGLIDSYEINNDSPAEVSRSIKVSEKITNEFSWGFSESLKTFSKVSGTVGIPFVVEGRVEAGFELNVEANQNWKSSTEKSFEMGYDVKIPANTRIRISASYDLINGISMDYTATTEITGKTVRFTIFNDLVMDSSATGEMILGHLKYSDFDGEILEVRPNSVIARIKGTMIASLGVRGKLNVDDKTVGEIV